MSYSVDEITRLLDERDKQEKVFLENRAKIIQQSHDILERCRRYKLRFVHKTGYWPDLMLQSYASASKNKIARNTIHFCLNSTVGNHMYGDWSDAPYVFILSFEDLYKKMVCLRDNDSFTFGNINLEKIKNKSECAIIVNDIITRKSGTMSVANDKQSLGKGKKMRIQDLPKKKCGISVYKISDLMKEEWFIINKKRVEFTKNKLNIKQSDLPEHTDITEIATRLYLEHAQRVPPAIASMWSSRLVNGSETLMDNPQEFESQELIEQLGYIKSDRANDLTSVVRTIAEVLGFETGSHTNTWWYDMESYMLNIERKLKGDYFQDKDRSITELEAYENLLSELLRHHSDIIVFETNTKNVVTRAKNIDDMLHKRYQLSPTKQYNYASLRGGKEQEIAVYKCKKYIQQLIVRLHGIHHSDGSTYTGKLMNLLEKEKKWIMYEDAYLQLRPGETRENYKFNMEWNYKIVRETDTAEVVKQKIKANKSKLRKPITEVQKIKRAERRINRIGHKLDQTLKKLIAESSDNEDLKKNLQRYEEQLLILNHTELANIRWLHQNLHKLAWAKTDSNLLNIMESVKQHIAEFHKTNAASIVVIANMQKAVNATLKHHGKKTIKWTG